MYQEYARLISLAIFLGMAPAMTIASFVLSNDLTLRRVVLLGLLGETLLAIVIEIPLASLITVGMFLHQFMRYLKLIDKFAHNMDAAFHGGLPPWARNTPNPEEVLNRLGQAGRHVGGTSLGTKRVAALPKPGQGRHRMQAV